MIKSFDYKGQQIVFEITNPEDHLQKYWLAGRFYEQGMLRFIEERWKNKSEHLTFIDVGACIGNHTVFFSKVIGAHVISFEPDIRNYNLLVRNIDLNNVGVLVSARYSAVGNLFKRVCFQHDTSNNCGMSKIAASGNEKVYVVPLDDTINDKSKVHLIKIDVEGYNLPVLTGAQGIITRDHPEIYIEAGTDEELKEVESFLLPLGYKRWPTPFNATPTYMFYY